MSFVNVLRLNILEIYYIIILYYSYFLYYIIFILYYSYFLTLVSLLHLSIAIRTSSIIYYLNYLFNSNHNWK